jgi:rRNA-processing protein FCF1
VIVVVQDANILIDLYKADLLVSFFELGFENHSTDLVLYEIKQSIHPYMEDGRIKQHALTSDQLEKTHRIQRTIGRGVSLPDCSVLWLSRELGRNTRLLTGDAKLRQCAENNGITVHGLLWILDQLVDNHIVSAKKTAVKLKELLYKGSRLPREECRKRISKWEK